MLHGFVLAFQHSHLSLNLLSLVLFALFHELSYLGSHFLTFLLCLVRLLLCLAATFVEFKNFLYGFFGTLEVLFLQAFDYAFSFLTDEFKCKHN